MHYTGGYTKNQTWVVIVMSDVHGHSAIYPLCGAGSGNQTHMRLSSACLEGKCPINGPHPRCVTVYVQVRSCIISVETLTSLPLDERKQI